MNLPWKVCYNIVISYLEATYRSLTNMKDILNRDYTPQWGLELMEALTLKNHFNYLNNYVIKAWEFVSKAQGFLWSFESQIS